MGWFSKKQTPLNSQEYEVLTKKLTEVIAEVDRLKATVKNLETDLSNLRGRFNSKIRFIEKEEKVAPKEESESNLKVQGLLSEDGLTI